MSFPHTREAWLPCLIFWLLGRLWPPSVFQAVFIPELGLGASVRDRPKLRLMCSSNPAEGTMSACSEITLRGSRKIPKAEAMVGSLSPGL